MWFLNEFKSDKRNLNGLCENWKLDKSFREGLRKTTLSLIFCTFQKILYKKFNKEFSNYICLIRKELSVAKKKRANAEVNMAQLFQEA